MDDFQIIVYIILVVIYILSRVLKAKKAVAPPKDIEQSREYRQTYNEPIPPVQSPASTTYSETPQPKQLTFEDLLKEFSGLDTQTQQKPAEQPTVYESLETIEPEYKEQERQTYETAESYESGSYEAPASYESALSYDELYAGKEGMSVTEEDTKKSVSKRFDSYTIKTDYNLHHAGRFRKLLKNPLSVKDAVILKEILDTKYF